MAATGRILVVHVLRDQRSLAAGVTTRDVRRDLGLRGRVPVPAAAEEDYTWSQGSARTMYKTRYTCPLRLLGSTPSWELAESAP